GKEGLQLETRNFILKRGDREVVRVSWAAGKPPEQPPPVQPAIKAGSPISPLALVRRPAALPGVKSWTIDTVHPRPVYVLHHGAAFSPDGRTLAVGTADGILRLLDPKGVRSPRVLLMDHVLPIVAVDWSPDGKLLAVGTQWAPFVVFWDPEAGRVVRTLRLDSDILDLTWSPDGKYLAIRAGGIQLWEAATARLHPPLPIPNGPLAWSPDSKALAVGNGKVVDV